MDAAAAGNAHSDAPAPPLLNDEQWSRMERRFLTEHTPLTVVEGDLLFLGWTSPRAWWEEES
jgi:hypothetical protein